MDLPRHLLLTYLREAHPGMLRSRHTRIVPPRHRFGQRFLAEDISKARVARVTVALLLAPVNHELVRIVKSNPALHAHPVGMLLGTLRLCLPPQLATPEAALVALANGTVCIRIARTALALRPHIAIAIAI